MGALKSWRAFLVHRRTAGGEIDAREARAYLAWKWISFAVATALLPQLAPGLPGNPLLAGALAAWTAHAVLLTLAVLRRPAVLGRGLAVHPSFLLDVVLLTAVILTLGDWRTPYMLLYPAHVVNTALVRPYWKDIAVVALAGLGAFVGAHTGTGHPFTPASYGHFSTEFVITGLLVVPPILRLRLLLDRLERTLAAQRRAEESAWTLARETARLREISVTDSLTGLFNKRYFDLRLAEEVARSRDTGQPLALLMLDIDYFKHYNDTFGHTAGDAVLREVARILRETSRQGDVPCRYGGEEFALILPGAGSEQALAVAERVRRAVAHHAFPGGAAQPEGRLTVSVGAAVFPADAAGAADLCQHADQALYRAKDAGRNAVRLFADGGPDGPEADAEEDARNIPRVIRSLMALANLKDRYTYSHSERVAHYAGAIAERLNLLPGEVRRIKYAALVHDLGFAGIDPQLLEKPGALTDKELEIVRAHTVLGVSIIEPFGDLRDLIPIVAHHHEHWDGSGYPKGLRGEMIPLGARILGVANAYDAMRRHRPYRAALSLEEAVRELRENAGTQFDPRIACLFVEHLLEIGEVPPDVLVPPDAPGGEAAGMGAAG